MAVGITERGDAGLYLGEWLNNYDNNPKLEFVIAITKNPKILLDNYKLLPDKTIIHCTITGWGGTTMEPNVPSFMNSLDDYFNLVKIFGPNRVVLRIDPIIPIQEGIDIAKKVMSYSRGRIRVSILDLYKHIIPRLYEQNRWAHDRLLHLYGNNIHLDKSLRAHILREFRKAEICGEPDFISEGCISSKDYLAFGLTPPLNSCSFKQRKSCRCISEKYELLKHKEPCTHGCLYCYWK